MGLWRSKKWKYGSKLQRPFGKALAHPLELKILAALRYIGRGECWDTSSELSGIPENTLRRFGHEFFRYQLTEPQLY